jgi:16S rRNA processing protein RimM
MREKLLHNSELITVGEISGVFGVKGWIKVYSYTDPRENILTYSPWIIKKGNQVKEVELVTGKRQGKSIVASIGGVTDRDVAATYSGWGILINKNQLPKTKEGEYYWLDLVGLCVETDLGVSLGKVDYLIETGANDVLVVKDKEQERLIPFLQKQTIKKIDLDDNLMIVDWDPDF